MAIEFTSQQKKILHARNHNILVSAAAGSGKTAVLVERIVRMISEGEHPMDIDRLLVVTFTRAAAAQMRERIAKAISKRLTEYPEDRHLQRQETLLHHAQITTIDSFCTFLLRNHFSEIHLDPGFRQMDETQSALLEKDVMKRFLEECYAGKEEWFLTCVEYFCQKKGDAELEELIMKLHRQADAHPFPEVWLEERKRDYDIASEEELFQCEWYWELLMTAAEQLPELARQHRAMVRLASLPDGPYPYLDQAEQEEDELFGHLEERSEEMLRQLGTGQSTAAVRTELLQIADYTFGKLATIRKIGETGIDPQKKDQFSDMRKDLKARMKKLKENVEEDPALTIARMQKVQEPVCGLLELTLGYRRMLREVKEERNMIDFSDLEHLALQILVERDENGVIHLRKAAQGLGAYYDEILIDEYQDSNDVQELLLSAVAGEKNCGFVYEGESSTEEHTNPENSGEGREIEENQQMTGTVNCDGINNGNNKSDANPVKSSQNNRPRERYARFMVGDVKQSIYRFRNARPEIFEAKFETYGFDDPETERIDLDQNFRSRVEVLDAANAICGKVMRREIGGVEYDDTVSLKLGAHYPEAEKADGDCGRNPYQTELLLVDGAVEDENVSSAGQDGTSSAAQAASKNQAAKVNDSDGSNDSNGVNDSNGSNNSNGTDDANGKDRQKGKAGADGGSDEDENDDSVASLTSAKKEALAVAQKIRGLMTTLKVTDEESGELRPVRYGDIVILLRSTAGKQEAFREIFEKEGIPLYLEYKGGYFAAEEIRGVLQALRVIDNPRQDIPLYGVLRGYFGGFTQDEIGELRAIYPDAKEQMLYDCVLAAAGREHAGADEYGANAIKPERVHQNEQSDPSNASDLPDLINPGNISDPINPSDTSDLSDPINLSNTSDLPDPIGPNAISDLPDSINLSSSSDQKEGTQNLPPVSSELQAHCRSFLTWLEYYRGKMSTTPIHALIGELVRETGYENYVRALPAGEKRFANLRSLLVKAAAFEQGDYAGLFRFLRYIDQMHEFDVDYGEANTLDEHADVVRMTTIHKSKGLEYPVCFVCGLGSRYAFTRDTNGTVILDSDLGLGASYVDTTLRSKVSTLRQKAVAEKITRASLGEELRVLYVAMTRAKEKLILTGFTRDGEKLERKIQTQMASMELPAEHLPVSMIRSSDGYLTLILESMEALKAEEREPVRLERVTVSDLELSEVENQMTQGILQKTLEQIENDGADNLPDPELAETLQRRFSYRYPHENLKGLYTKTTVSELKRAAMLGESEQFQPGEGAVELYAGAEDASAGIDLPVPRFAMTESAETLDREAKENADNSSDINASSEPSVGAETKPSDGGIKPEVNSTGNAGSRLTGTARGTAIHRMCEKINYKHWSNPATVTAEQFRERVDALIADGTFPAEYGSVLKSAVFLPFLRSNLAARMAAADAKGLLRREQPFVLGVPADRMNAVFPHEETILVQGIIDAFFIEGEGEDRHIVVVDYKTDRVKTGQELCERYRVQLEDYAEALEKMLRLPVTEKIIYSFRLQCEVKC